MAKKKKAATAAPKILLVSDSPFASTGLGRMSRYFLTMLPEYDWTVWGFMHPEFTVRKGQWLASYDEKAFPGQFRVISPKTFTDDTYGIDILPDILRNNEFDFLLTSMDYDRLVRITPQIKEVQFSKALKWINYFPMDREDYKIMEPEALRSPDVNVCITKFGVEKINSINPKLQIEQIYHPIDANEFPEISEEEVLKFKHSAWKDWQDSDFFIGTVNRSFSRKDTPRLVRLLSEYIKARPDTYAYVHGKNSTFEGMDLEKLAFETGIPAKRLAFLPQNVTEIDAFPQDILNKIYRSFDLFTTVSSGEGFGFTTVEALLTETPIIAPHNTSFPELVQDFGYLVPTSEMTFFSNTNTSMWPVVNIETYKKQIDYVRNNYEEAKEKAKAGSKWVKENLNLDIIADQWRKILVK